MIAMVVALISRRGGPGCPFDHAYFPRAHNDEASEPRLDLFRSKDRHDTVAESLPAGGVQTN